MWLIGWLSCVESHYFQYKFTIYVIIFIVSILRTTETYWKVSMKSPKFWSWCWVVYKGYTMQLSVALAFSVDVYWRSRVYWTNPYLFVYAFCNPQLRELRISMVRKQEADKFTICMYTETTCSFGGFWHFFIKLKFKMFKILVWSSRA